MPYSKNVIGVNVPKNSGANMSHRNTGTLTCGTLTPLLVEEVIPGTRCHLKIPEVVQLPPLASDTYMNVKLKHEAFFVPFRILCRSFEDWFSENPKRVGIVTSAQSTANPSLGSVDAALPVFRLTSNASTLYYGAGSLLDYLGFKSRSIPSGAYKDISPMSILAYHMIWQEWYRNPRVQQPCFTPILGKTDYSYSASFKKACQIPYEYYHYSSTIGGSTVYQNNIFVFDGSQSGNTTTTPATMSDGVGLFSLRQRNFGLDFYTGCRISPTLGPAPAVSMNVVPGASPDPDTTSFTISQLRAANSLQMFRERNNLPSPRLVDQIMARYGVRLADGVAQRPVFIGSSSFDVVTRGVDQTAGDSTTSSQNPFNSVASQYGRAFAMGNGTLIEDFEVKEPGLIMVLQSLVPEVTYSTGVAPYLQRYVEQGSVVEMANPLLQNLGDEPVYRSTISNDATDNQVFAYNDRYGTFMFHPNECHGLMSDGQSLSSFVLQRSFSVSPAFGNSFLEIPKNYLDKVFAVSSGVSGLSAWYDAKLEWKISLPLAEFSIPSLQDPAYEHGRQVNLIRNGQVF